LIDADVDYVTRGKKMKCLPSLRFEIGSVTPSGEEVCPQAQQYETVWLEVDSLFDSLQNTNQKTTQKHCWHIGLAYGYTAEVAPRVSSGKRHKMASQRAFNSVTKTHTSVWIEIMREVERKRKVHVENLPKILPRERSHGLQFPAIPASLAERCRENGVDVNAHLRHWTTKNDVLKRTASE
jgi:hypothetical protein